MDDIDDTISGRAGARWAALYRTHLDMLKGQFGTALATSGYNTVVIGAGTEIYRFLDDQTYPFKPNPHFIRWLPLTQHPESCLIYRPGERPRVIVYRPDDYWRKPPDLTDGPWRDHFEVSTIGDLNALHGQLEKLPAPTAWIGEPAQWRGRAPKIHINPINLLNELHYHRPFKSDYEIECIRCATRRSAPAHRAAAAAFRQGASEQEILIAFLNACGQTENDLPYPAIVATNTNGAVLHYQHYTRERNQLHSLLIDAACGWNGYAADITRTYAFEDDGFADMVTDLNEAQQQLCAQVKPGASFLDLHHEAHRCVAGLLRDWGLINRAPDDLVEQGITALFFPHGLGHFLGLQVHDVGGSMADALGTEIEPSARYPHLRLRRILAAGQVLTIEPGIYFIDSLLAQLHKSSVANDVDWKRIDELKKFGGIRIEDDLVVTPDGADNLTREAFEEMGGE